MNKIIAALCVFVLAGMASDSAVAGGDAEKGALVFNSCESCHMVGNDAEILVGPPLNALVGRPAGSLENYRYSNLSRAAGAEGLVWSEENLSRYLEDPTKFLSGYLTEKGKENLAKGRSRMSFRLRKMSDAENVIAYIKTLSNQK